MKRRGKDGRFRRTVSEKDAVRLYLDDKLSSYAVAKKLGCSRGTISTLLNKLGVVRTLKEASRLSIEKGRHVRAGIRSGKPCFTPQGYAVVYVPDHPMATSIGLVRRSHLVWEEYTGHVVSSGEVIHHKNEQKWDDRFENLELMTDFQHKSLHSRNRKGRKRKV